MGYRRPSPRFQPGMLTMQDAQALNEAMDALYRLVGGFTAVPPLEVDEGSGGVCYRLKGALGSSGISWLNIVGPSTTDPAIYDATVQQPTPNQLAFAAAGGPSVWAWNYGRTLISAYPPLTNGIPYPSLAQNGSFTAMPFAGGGPAQQRSLYIVIGGWVIGGGQCLPGGGIGLTTF